MSVFINFHYENVALGQMLVFKKNNFQLSEEVNPAWHSTSTEFAILKKNKQTTKPCKTQA